MLHIYIKYDSKLVIRIFHVSKLTDYKNKHH